MTVVFIDTVNRSIKEIPL